jgi:cytochrome c oxidase subunit II
MRLQRFRFIAVLAVFAFIWLFVRFPYQMRELLASPNRIDPATLHLAGEFVESNLGTAREADGSLTVRVIAQQFMFVPSCVRVAAGVPIRLRIASADVVHRFTIEGTDREMEIVPGHVSESRIQFDTPGIHKTPCHEFCGAGHYNMHSRIVAVAADRFPNLKPEERLTCGAR